VDRPPQPTLLEQLGEWLRHWAKTHLGFLHRLFSGIRGTGEVLEVVVLIAVGAGLVIAGARIFLMMARDRTPVDATPGDVEKLGAVRTAAHWRALAVEAASQGRYEAAIAAFFMAALRLLDEAGVIAFDAARTPGEYRRLVRRALDEAAPAFDGLAGRFVYATYGGHEASAQDYAAAQHSYTTFAPLVTHR